MPAHLTHPENLLQARQRGHDDIPINAVGAAQRQFSFRRVRAIEPLSERQRPTQMDSLHKQTQFTL